MIVYNPASLTLALNEFPNLVAELAEVECGEYCSCETYQGDCFSGQSIDIQTKSSDLTFTAIWSDLGEPYPEGCQVIILLPPGGFASSLHQRVKSVQRMGGGYGAGPDFVNFEPHEWQIHGEGFMQAFQDDFAYIEYLRPLPDAIHTYIEGLESLHHSMQPPYVCPVCHDASCDATSNRESPCTYTDEL